MNIGWPDISFGPVNLIILPPAWWFYSNQEERDDYSKAIIKDAKEETND